MRTYIASSAGATSLALLACPSTIRSSRRRRLCSADDWVLGSAGHHDQPMPGFGTPPLVASATLHVAQVAAIMMVVLMLGAHRFETLQVHPAVRARHEPELRGCLVVLLRDVQPSGAQCVSFQLAPGFSASANPEQPSRRRLSGGSCSQNYGRRSEQFRLASAAHNHACCWAICCSRGSERESCWFVVDDHGVQSVLFSKIFQFSARTCPTGTVHSRCWGWIRFWICIRIWIRHKDTPHIQQITQKSVG